MFVIVKFQNIQITTYSLAFHYSKHIKLAEVKDEIIKKCDPLGIHSVAVQFSLNENATNMLNTRYKFKTNPEVLFAFLHKSKGGELNFEAIQRALQPHQKKQN